MTKKQRKKATLIREELKKIRTANRNKPILPEAVVSYAEKHRGSALHREFVWDNEKAGHGFRLIQAAKILRVYNVVIVTPEHSGKQIKVNGYRSLPDRRGHGYESTEDILDDEDRTFVMLQDTIKRLVSIKEVEMFAELADVHTEIQKVANEYLPERNGKYKAAKKKSRRRWKGGDEDRVEA